MPYRVSWMQHGHIILIEFSGNVTLDDLREQLALTVEMSESVDTPLVHTIVDALNVTSYPMSLKEYSKVYTRRAQNLGWTIFVTHHQILRFFSKLVTHFSDARYASVDSIDQALRYIAARDAQVEYTMWTQPDDTDL